MAKIKPALILALIAAIISCLIIVVYKATYKDTSLEVTDKEYAAVSAIYEGAKTDFTVIPLEKYPEALRTTDADGKTVCTIPELKKIVKKNDGSVAFSLEVKGYKKGFGIMVGVKDDVVTGVSVVTVGEETPGLGTNTNKPEFLDCFKGITGKAEIVKSNPDSSKGQVQAVTSATYSSKGVAKAVNLALEVYKLSGGDFE
ncbi:MAG: FMN-binding protein [Oscillospiraceae bacterium]